MEVSIKNHSDGTLVGVTKDHQIIAQAEVHELQHHIAINHGQTYHVQAIDTGVTATTQTILHLQNNDPDRQLVIAEIRIQAINTATVPVESNFYEIGTGTVVDSGGSPVIPVNTSVGSGKIAQITATTNDPTVTGTFLPFDIYYPKSNGDEISYNKRGAIILGLNDSVEIRHTATGTGVTKARITFMMDDEFEPI